MVYQYNIKWWINNNFGNFHLVCKIISKFKNICQLNVLGSIFSILKEKGLFQEKHFGGQGLVQKTHRVLGQRYDSKQKHLSLKCSWLILFFKVTTKWNPMLILFSWRNFIPQKITRTRQQAEKNTPLLFRRARLCNRIQISENTRIPS